MLLLSILKLKILSSGKYLTRFSAVRKYLPHLVLSQVIILSLLDYDLKVSTIAPGEELSISAKMSLHTAA